MLDQEIAIMKWCNMHGLGELPNRLLMAVKAIFPDASDETRDSLTAALLEVFRSEILSGRWVRESRVTEKVATLKAYVNSTKDSRTDALYAIANKLSEIEFLSSAPAI